MKKVTYIIAFAVVLVLAYLAVVEFRMFRHDFVAADVQALEQAAQSEADDDNQEERRWYIADYIPAYKMTVLGTFVEAEERYFPVVKEGRVIAIVQQNRGQQPTYTLSKELLSALNDTFSRSTTAAIIITRDATLVLGENSTIVGKYEVSAFKSHNKIVVSTNKRIQKVEEKRMDIPMAPLLKKEVATDEQPES